APSSVKLHPPRAAAAFPRLQITTYSPLRFRLSSPGASLLPPHTATATVPGLAAGLGVAPHRPMAVARAAACASRNHGSMYLTSGGKVATCATPSRRSSRLTMSHAPSALIQT